MLDRQSLTEVISSKHQLLLEHNIHLYSLMPHCEKTGATVTLYPYIRKVPGSNLARDTGYPNWSFRGSPQSLQTNLNLVSLSKFCNLIIIFTLYLIEIVSYFCAPTSIATRHAPYYMVINGLFSSTIFFPHWLINSTVFQTSFRENNNNKKQILPALMTL